MINDKELNEMKDIIFEGKYNGKVLAPLTIALTQTDEDRRKAKEYIKQNNLENTTPGRAFATAEKHFSQASHYYMQAKKLLDKLR